MRRSLKTKHKERVDRKNFRVLRHQIERNRWSLRNGNNLSPGFNASNITPSGGSGGDSGYYADAEHTHSGQPYIAADDLPAYHETLRPNGVFGYDTNDHKIYAMVNQEWSELGGFETVAVLPAVPVSGYKVVYHSGNNLLWYSAQGFTRWYNISGKWSSLSGAVGT